MNGTKNEYKFPDMKGSFGKILFLVAGIAIFIMAVFPAGRSCADQGVDDDLSSAILARINEARQDPWAEAERLGLDIDALRESVGPSVAALWDQGLKPLAWNTHLAESAQSHIQDMLEHLYYSHISQDGRNPLDRIKGAGTIPLFFAESMGAVAFENVISSEEAAGLILDGLLTDAFNNGKEGAPLLDHVLTNIGFGFFGGRLTFDQLDLNVFVFVADLMVPDPRHDHGENAVGGGQFVPSGQGNHSNGEIWGRVYQDLNGNGQYDPGEGLGRQPIVLEGPFGVYGPVNPTWTLITGCDGVFKQLLPAGEYSITYNSNDAEYQLNFSVNGGFSPVPVDITVKQ